MQSVIIQAAEFVEDNPWVEVRFPAPLFRHGRAVAGVRRYSRFIKRLTLSPASARPAGAREVERLVPAAILLPGVAGVQHAVLLLGAVFSWRGLVLAALLAAAVVVGRLTARVPASPSNGQVNRSETERLYEFTRSTTQLDLHRKPGPQLASLVQANFDIDSVAIFDADLDEVYSTGTWSKDLEDSVRSIYIFETVRDDPETGLVRRVLRVGKLPIGALVLRGEMSELTSSAVASLIAITFDRFHSFANETRSERARRAEQLRSTVLDSLAHAYKTPLTAIQAASTGLAEMGTLTTAQAALVALIAEQSAQLSTLTTRLLKTSSLEAHDLTLHVEGVELASLIEDVVASEREQLAGRQVRIELPGEHISVVADRTLVEALLTQFVDNAAKYADPGTPVTIDVKAQSQTIVLSVHNFGPVIGPEDRERVFERYFRGSGGAERPSGTGIGLSIARHAAQAHGGDVWVTSDLKHGTTFFASLPTSTSVLISATIPGGVPTDEC